jgi:hypothetical protein
MPHYSDEVTSYTRDDLLQALADEMGSRADDPRILDAYDQIVSEWALAAEDPDAGCARYFRDGPVATGRDLVAVQDWPRGASCCSRALRLARSARCGICAVTGALRSALREAHMPPGAGLAGRLSALARVACPMGGRAAPWTESELPGRVLFLGLWLEGPAGSPNAGRTVYRNAPASVARSTWCGGALVSAAFRGFTPV